MADKKISQLALASTPLSGGETLPVVQTGTTVQVSVANLTAGRGMSATSVANGLGAVGTPSYTFTGDTNTGVWSPAADTVAVSTAGTERTRIDSSGRVGIGTSAPSALLDVAGDAQINGLTVGRGAGNISSNTASGFQALFSNTTGFNNAAFGREALISNTTGNNNTASGFQTLFSNATGSNNTASGRETLRSNTTGDNNTASGLQALRFNTTGNDNTASGWRALFSNTTASNNTAFGYAALFSNTTGFNNAAFGREALISNTTGSNNTALGEGAGSALTTGSNNTIIGRVAGTEGLDSTVIIAAGTTERMRIDSSGNVGIGTTSPNAAARLDVSSTTSGFLPPRMTGAQRDAIATPPNGLMLYNTTTNKLQVRAAGSWVDLH